MLVAQHLGHPKCFKSTHWQWSVYYLATNFTNELKNPSMAGKLIQILNFTRITK